MNKSFFIILWALLFPTQGFSHNGGHGPKLTDVGFFGGIVASVIDSSEASQGTKATLLYKAELVRSADQTVRIYLYDKALKPLSSDALNSFDKNARAFVIVSREGQKDLKLPFSLQLKGKSFIGKAPQAASKPFNINILLKSKDQKKEKELLVAFDNLD